MRARLGSIDRTVAAALAIAWLAAALAGWVAAYLLGRELLAAAAGLALCHAVLWARVAMQPRLLRWTEIAAPWRARPSREANDR